MEHGRLATDARTGLRLFLGYLLAVAAGAVVFTALARVALTSAFGPDPTGVGTLVDLLLSVSFYFTTGAIFGLPYTLIGMIVFLRWLPKSKSVFLLLGMLCPFAAALLLVAAMDYLPSIDTEFLTIMLLTLPAGLAAAYVFGAIGMGYGFGRWRFR